jgi:hypothetical protein
LIKLRVFWFFHIDDGDALFASRDLGVGASDNIVRAESAGAERGVEILTAKLDVENFASW